MEAANSSQKTARNRLHGVTFQNIRVTHRPEYVKSHMACTYLSKHSSTKLQIIPAIGRTHLLLQSS